MTTGTVKWFNGQKGFGFIQPNDGGNDVFVHISAVERAGLSGLNEGQKVNFELKTDKMRGKVSAENCWPEPSKPFHGCTEMAWRPLDPWIGRVLLVQNWIRWPTRSRPRNRLRVLRASIGNDWRRKRAYGR